jgi:hypothetical protein
MKLGHRIGAVIYYSREHFVLCVAFALVALAVIWLAPQPNTETYSHVAVVADGLDGPGTGLGWRIEGDTLWIFLR